MDCSRHIFSHTAERLPNRRKEPKTKISACLHGTRTPSNVDNISEIDLCAIVAESNIEWITYRFIPCYIIIINIYGYIFIRSLCRHFLFYTQSSGDMRLIFHAKLTVFYMLICFVSNIYAGFILFKKMCASFKNWMCNGMFSFLRKICFIQEHRWRANNYRQRKKVVGAARFSFHICPYIEEMIMLHDLLLF